MLMVGVGILVLMHNMPYKWFQVFHTILYPLSVGLLVLITIVEFVTNDRVNGAAHWTSYVGIQFQPSELAKMAVIIVVAFLLSKKQDGEDGENPKTFKHILILSGIICFLIGIENFSTAALLFCVVYAMMFIGRIAWKKLLGLAGGLFIVGAIGVAVIVSVPEDTNIPFLHRASTWKSRINGFMNDEYIPPAKYDIDKNGQIAHARIAIATSNVLGKGPGNSVQRDFLSQAFSDFIFAIIIEELGLLGAAGVVILYIWLLIRAGKIAQKCERAFPAFLVMGIALMLVSQALINMAVAVGLGPVTGQPLPLVSKGGTATFINCAFIGMILSVSRYTAALEEKKRLEAEGQIESTEEQSAAEPTAQVLNSDVVFEEETSLN